MERSSNRSCMLSKSPSNGQIEQLIGSYSCVERQIVAGLADFYAALDVLNTVM